MLYVFLIMGTFHFFIFINIQMSRKIQIQSSGAASSTAAKCISRPTKSLRAFSFRLSYPPLHGFSIITVLL